MDLLQNIDRIKKLDTKDCFTSIFNLSLQCKASWDEVNSLSFPVEFENSKNIVFCGMGGSAYGGRIVKSLFQDSLNAGVDLVTDYQLPKYVSKDSLIICASYSGNTEETISCLNEAIDRNLRIICVSSGGFISQIASQNKIPSYIFNPVYNPSGQPRLGQGYMQMGQLAILNKLNLIQISDTDISDVFQYLKTLNEVYNLENNSVSNPAKKYALEFENKMISIIGCAFLEGAIHSIRNPMNETGKHFSDYFIIPEANHHLMEGLSFPLSLRNNMGFLLIHSSLYSDKLTLRMKLTKEIILKNGLSVHEIYLKSKGKLGQVFELIQFGSYLSFYLGVLHGVNPAEIPWVDYFKSKLS